MITTESRIVTGVDLVEIARFRRLIGTDGARAIPWLFTDAERAYASSFRDPVPRLAARFAAKEAVVKIIDGVSPFSFDWRTIEIVTSPQGGKPSAMLLGKTAEAAERANLMQIELSITHTRNFAAAVAVGILSR